MSNYVNFLARPRFLIAFAVVMAAVYVSTIFTGELSEVAWTLVALLTFVFVALCATAFVRWLIRRAGD